MPRKVLIMERDAARGEAIARVLHEGGFQTETAADPLRAMGVVRGGELDALVASAQLGAALKGVFQMARRRSPEVSLCVLGAPVDGLEIEGGYAVVDEGGIPELCARVELGRPGAAPAPVEAAPAPVEAAPAPVEVAPVAAAPAPPAGGPLHGDGARWLMVYSARAASGWLELEGAELWSRLYLHEGSPVWVAPAGGDREVYEQLRAAKLLLPSDPVEPVPEGQLLASLYERGIIAPLLVERFVRKALKKALSRFFELEAATLRFHAEVPAGEPIVRVNPFGMIFEHQRASHTPDALLRKGRTMRGVRVHPRASLAPARESVRPFVRGLDVTEVIDGRTIEEFNTTVGHDEVMGTTVILALEAAGLCELEGAP